MAERNSWAVSDAPNGVITTEDARLAINALMQAGPTPVTSRNGIRVGQGDPGRVAAGPTPGTVTVQPFQMFMRPKRGIGSYVQTLDAVKELNLLKDYPAHSQYSRYDFIIAQQSDKFYGDNNNSFMVRHVPGNASATPADPTVPGSADYVVLARIRIPANATTIANETIEDRRPGWVVGIGGVAPMRGPEERDAAATHHGLTAYRQDRRWLEIHDGSRWRVPSIPVCSSLADITTAITNPHLGQLVFSTEDRLIYLWDGSAWVGAVTTSGSTAATRHEARYEIHSGQEQSFVMRKDTRVPFPSSIYTTSDVTQSAAYDTFTLNRAGIWSISVSLRFYASGSDANYSVYLGIVDSPSNFSIRYANTIQLCAGRNFPPTLNCSTQNFFAAGSQICAVLYPDLAVVPYTDWQNVNNITLTWLRP